MRKHKRKSGLSKFSLRFWRRLPAVAKRVEFLIIVGAVLVIGAAILVAIFFNSEAVTKRNLAAMAEDYYENYYYDKFMGSVEETEAMMNKYEVTGFPTVSLEQLLLFDNRRNAEFATTMEKNCDTSATTIRIFPEAPFGRKNYHIEYNYSCNF